MKTDRSRQGGWSSPDESEKKKGRGGQEGHEETRGMGKRKKRNRNPKGMQKNVDWGQNAKARRIEKKKGPVFSSTVKNREGKGSKAVGGLAVHPKAESGVHAGSKRGEGDEYLFQLLGRAPEATRMGGRGILREKSEKGVAPRRPNS